jgi:hypothetical protein
MVGDLADNRRKSWSAETQSEPTPQASRQATARQTIGIELTEEQVDALRGQWQRINPDEPAEITVYLGQRPVGELSVSRLQFHE